MTGASPVFRIASQRALYIGPGLAADVHAHHAVQVCLPIVGSVRLRRDAGEPWREYAGAVIPASCPHESDVAVDAIATVWLANVSFANGSSTSARERTIRPLDDKLADAAVAGLTAWRSRTAEESPDSVLDWLEDTLFGRARFDTPIDPRVEQAVTFVSTRLPERPSATDVARHVGLSVGRLQHLFTASVGVPLRRYVLWAKLQRAVEIIATGVPLADAAVDAGFADQAHLSRTFRRMLGFTPTAAMSRFVQDRPGRPAVASTP